MSGGITVKEFKHVPGVNDAEYIKLLKEQNEINKNIIGQAVAKIKRLSAHKRNDQTGEWIYGESEGHDGWFCGQCGFFVPLCYGYNKNSHFIEAYKTCPYCDAKMVSYTGR